MPYCAYDSDPRLAPLGVRSHFSPSGDELVLHSPGMINCDWLRAARDCGCTCLGELDYAQRFYRNRTVALTGTNGKTSTAHMLVHVLRRLGQPCLPTGNLGVPLIGAVEQLAAAPDTWNVCEVSSFQANDLCHFSPDILLWTNFSDNHRDIHGSLAAYWFAKWNLLKRCRGIAFVGEGLLPWTKKFNCPLPANVRVVAAELADDVPRRGALAPAHQRANYAIVRELLSAEGFSVREADRAMADFRTPPHRLAICRTIGAVDIWNDSKATTAAAAAAALAHVAEDGRPCLWIACGRSKGEDLENFRPLLARAAEVLAFGEIAAPLAEKFGKKVQILGEKEQLFPSIGDFIRRRRGRPAAVLFSPGCASFDAFSDYGDRGNWFVAGMELLPGK